MGATTVRKKKKASPRKTSLSPSTGLPKDERVVRILQMLSDGWQWRYTQNGRVAHAVHEGTRGICGVWGWRKAAPSPEVADKQETRTLFCQRCVGRIVRNAQGEQ